MIVADDFHSVIYDSEIISRNFSDFVQYKFFVAIKKIIVIIMLSNMYHLVTLQ